MAPSLLGHGQTCHNITSKSPTVELTELPLVVPPTLTIVLTESSSIHSHTSHVSLYLARQWWHCRNKRLRMQCVMAAFKELALKKIPQHSYFCSSHKPLLFVANRITSYKDLPGSCETVKKMMRGSYEHYQLWINNESVNNECKWSLKRSQLWESRVYSFRCSNSSSLFHLHPVCQEMNQQRSYKEKQRGRNNITTMANQVISRVDRVIQGDTVFMQQQY